MGIFYWQTDSPIYLLKINEMREVCRVLEKIAQTNGDKEFKARIPKDRSGDDAKSIGSRVVNFWNTYQRRPSKLSVISEKSSEHHLSNSHISK